MTICISHAAYSLIPDPSEVQRLLAQAYNEAALLRGLLRLAKRKRQAMEREQLQRREGSRTLDCPSADDWAKLKAEEAAR
jgi:hypothetical protein